MDIKKLCIPLQSQTETNTPQRETKVLKNAEIAQLVQHNLAKVGVASSSLVFRSTSLRFTLGLFLCHYGKCGNVDKKVMWTKTVGDTVYNILINRKM